MSGTHDSAESGGRGATEDVLRVRDLSTRFFTQEGQVNAVSGLDLTVRRGEVYGIVGESGSGKSVTALSLMDLVSSPGEVVAGELWYNDPDLAAAVRDGDLGTVGDGDDGEAVDGPFVDLLSVPASVREALRGTHFAMIFQDPESSLNPSLPVGEQIAEAVEVQRRASARPRSTAARTESEEYSLSNLVLSSVLPSRRYVSEESRERAIELLELVGIPDPVERAEEYPHEYSGGMLQRAMIAQALAGEPDVLIADEPTTALDVTIQAQILELLADLQAETGMTVLLITHDLGVVARTCDRVGVMYAGEIVERGTLADVFRDHVHPYTAGLLGSIPDLESAGGRLEPIRGNVPSLLDHEMEDRCYFADRCPKAMEPCLEHPPEYDAAGSEDHLARCVLAERAYDESIALPEGYFDDSEMATDERTDAAGGAPPEAAREATRGQADATGADDAAGSEADARSASDATGSETGADDARRGDGGEPAGGSRSERSRSTSNERSESDGGDRR